MSFKFYIFYVTKVYQCKLFFSMCELVKYDIVTNSQYVLAMVGDNDLIKDFCKHNHIRMEIFCPNRDVV